MFVYVCLHHVYTAFLQKYPTFFRFLDGVKVSFKEVNNILYLLKLLDLWRLAAVRFAAKIPY